jgi:putative membrane protein
MKRMNFVGPAGFVAFLAVVSLSGAGLVGCDDDDDTQQTGTLTENEVLGVMLAANTGEISAGELALMRAIQSQVRDYAQRMVTEHTAANIRANTLAQTANLREADSAPRQMLQAETARVLAQLQPFSGTEFDRAYMESQVLMHDMVLRLIDDELLPSARNASLRGELTTMRASVAEHLMEARRLLGIDGGVDGGR